MINKLCKSSLQHLCHPFSKKKVRLEKWQKAVALTGFLLTPFLIIPGFLAFYGLSYYFKQKKFKSLKGLSKIDQIANQFINKSNKKNPKGLSTVQKDSLAFHSRKIIPRIKLIQTSGNSIEKLSQFDLIKKVVVDEDLDWDEYLHFLKSKDPDNFYILLKTSLLKKDQNITSSFLRLTDLDELNKQFQDLTEQDCVKLFVKNGHFKLSKRLLATFIPYFAAKLSRGIHEDNTREILMKGVSYSTFKDILNLFLFKKAVHIDENSIREFIYLAQLFASPKLKACCKDFLNKHFSKLASFSNDLFRDPDIAPRNAINKEFQNLINKGKRLSASDKKTLEQLLPFVTKLTIPAESNSRVIPLLSKMARLKTLKITIFNSRELLSLQSLKQIKHLHLTFDPISFDPTHLPALKKLPVTAITLNHCSVTDEDLKSLKESQGIKKIELSYCRRITNEGLANLIELPRLQKLDLSYCNIFTNNSQTHLSAFKKLQHIDLSHTNVSNKDLSYLAGLPEMKTLKLKLCKKITNKGFKYVGKLINLRILNLSGTEISNRGLAHLAGLKKLKELGLSVTKIKDKGLAHLAQFTELQVLDLSYTKITDTGVAHLGKLKKLLFIDLSETKVTNKSLGLLNKLKYLRSIKVAFRKITNNGLAHLANFKKLQTIDLTGTKVSNNGLRHLEGLNKLNDLKLSYTQVSDNGVAKVIKLRKLSSLDLRGTKITKKGLALLSEHKKLESLDLSFCSIKPKDLACVAKFKRLQRLIVNNYKISSKNLKDFEALRERYGLPKLMIVNN